MTVKYDPYWPEILFFIGAGATQALGFQTTNQLAKDIKSIVNIEDDENLSDIFYHESPAYLQSIIDLLDIIDSKSSEEDKEEARKRQGISKERFLELNHIYDLASLREVVRRCPRDQDKNIQLQDLYNMIDMHRQTGHGFRVDQFQIRPEQMNATRATANLLISLLHGNAYYKMLKTRADTYQHYIEFGDVLAELMNEEGLKLASKYELDQRDFYLFSYGIISMNWDPLFLWIIFNAHKTHNDRPSYIGTPALPMKLFNDLAHFMAVRGIEEETPQAWFPMNETAVQRLNDPEHQTGRRVRVGKFYFPHGSHGFRECPRCGKLTFFLGNKWDVHSTSVFPPQIVKSLAYPNNYRSQEEYDAISKGYFDSVQCSHCGEITEAHHTPIIMQTNFKGDHPPYIEEIQRDMKVAIEKAKHLIFFGYSLPPDDVTYRSIISSRTGMETKAPNCSIVNYDSKAPDKWLKGKELSDFIDNVASDDTKKTLSQFSFLISS